MEEAHHFVTKHVGQEMLRQKKYYEKQLNWSKFRKDDQVYVFYIINCGRRGRPQVIHVDRMRLCKGQLLRGETEINENENQDDTFEPEGVVTEISNDEPDNADTITRSK